MDSKQIRHCLVLGLLGVGGLTIGVRAADDPANLAVGEMPAGYQLQVYDDCGVIGLQPHVEGTQVHTFSGSDVKADEKARSVAWGWRQINASYDSLNPQLGYVLAVTYATEPFNARVQSLWAGSIQLHGPHALPKGKSERLLFRIPRSATASGKLALQFKLEGPVNVVVSAIELWAPASSPKVLNLSAAAAPYCEIEGRVLNLACDGIGAATVRLQNASDSKELATTKTAADGTFHFERRDFKAPAADSAAELRITATHDKATASRTISVRDLAFEPVRYRPAPAAVAGLQDTQMSLDGTWRINLNASEGLRKGSLESSGWSDVKVPGQWIQQGHDVPQDKVVAMAREFEIPAAWKGHRIVLRFEAIHAGTRYWLNGKVLGESENLFTPVEWDITEAAKIGDRNRLDLEMKVDTASEKLSYASGYAFHNLGGIDRSVRIFALPAIHIRSLRVTADLDSAYRDGVLQVQVGVENRRAEPAPGLTLELALSAPDGQAVSLPLSKIEFGAEKGSGTFCAQHPSGRSGKRFLTPFTPKTETLATRVASPLKWNAEQPNLYKLSLELKQNGDLLERIERNIGFRKIEIRERQFYVNGVRVKLAGACHHEVDPLTGRADTARHAERDVKLLKSANLNHLRTSHYPPNQELLDAADRLGVYVEVEAPFCWVNAGWDLTHCRKILEPTSAMIDYCHLHPSVIYWSLANESSFCRFFEISNRLCKELDPTRPTTFNNPDPKRICDIGNLHYPTMPYDDAAKDDPRPVMLGEYFFPASHSQIAVRTDPGLREYFAAGHSDPDSEWGKKCAAEYPATIAPGGKPGGWTHIYRSNMIIGGDIWALLDEPFYFSNGKRAGYAWVHGFWGIVDAWRRPKPEHFLSKLIFSPAWFPVRQFDLPAGRKTIEIPVENRYSFTNLNTLDFAWEAAGHQGKIKLDAPPASTGKLEIPVPPGIKAGDDLFLRVRDADGELITAAAIKLGQRKPEPFPEPSTTAPKWHDDGQTIAIEGDGFALVLDKSTGDLKTTDARHKSAVIRFPSVHLTRFDYGDLGPPGAPLYAVLPARETRVVEAVTAAERNGALELTVKDRYEGFAGTISWLIDGKGVGRISCNYVNMGSELAIGELGVSVKAKAECDEIRWRRWSEWGDIYPEDDIGRTEGTAKCRRDAKWGPVDTAESVRPTWPWSLDQTELGTNDFRATKFNIYEALLTTSAGAGIRVRANSDVHVRACLEDGGVKLHLLSQCRMAPLTLKKGEHIRGTYLVELLPR